MDVVERAIEQGLHISKNRRLNTQEWSDFEKYAKGKKIILFGVGAGAESYFERYKEKTKLEGVVDNNIAKHGICIDEFIAGAFGLECGRVVISDISLLQKYNTDELVILINSTKYYEEIAEQLESLGIKNYFVLLIMEANRRKEQPQLHDKEDDLKTSMIAYARECCKKEKIEKKKIFLSAYGNYADHEKYITEALLRIRSDLDIIWAVNDLTVKLPEGIRKVYKGNWKRFIYEMETARFWILDLAVPSYIQKRSGQVYIQTKHWASITLKKFYLDAVTFGSVPELTENWKRDGQMIDHIVVGSEFDAESCRRGFGFNGEFLWYGSPRSDGLFHEKENKEKVYHHYQLDENIHTLLYAPTYRFDKEKGKNFHKAKKIELDFEQIKEASEERFGGEWYILLRLHPSVASAFKNEERPSFVIDVSDYDDSQELVSAADITISDFSSIMFEPAFVKKPVFLFATDLQDYLANEYDLLIEYHELPFPIAETNTELVECIKDFSEQKYVEDVTAFLNKYGVHEDGHAGDRVAEYISNYIGQ